MGLSYFELCAVREHLERNGGSVPKQLREGLAKCEATSDEQARERIARAVGVMLNNGDELRHPTFIGAEPKQAARLILGEAPARVLKGLTRKEAHEALCDGGFYPTAVSWVCRDWPSEARSLQVARWAEACLRDPARKEALLKKRVEIIGGARVEGSLFSRLEEVRVVDLENGLRSGVVETFERAGKRALAEWEKLGQDDERALAPVPRWWVPLRCARLLRTRAELIAEGRAMSHCVSTYAPMVARKECVIVSLYVPTKFGFSRSTLELSPTGGLRQHKAASNKAPNASNTKVANILLRRIEARQEELRCVNRDL